MISIVIVNYNGKHFLENCLYSLSTQTYKDYEVVIVDNASSDGSVAYIQHYYPWVKLIQSEFNSGFAGGVNQGIKNSKGKYILTLNNDTTIHTQFLEKMLECIESEDKVGSCASKMVYPDGRINSTGICVSRSGAAWDRGMLEHDENQYDEIEEIFGPCAGAALYRKEMLEEIGLFDKDFFLYFEDVDIAFRAQLAGWKCLYTPYAKVTHIHGGTAGVGSDIAIYYGNRNILWCAIKNFPLKLLLISLPWIVGRNIAIIPYYALNGKGSIILKAKISALKGLLKTIKKRQSFNDKDCQNLDKFINKWCKAKST